MTAEGERPGVACARTGPVAGLFGISGVGKTWLGSGLVAAMPNILHLQASTLLRQAHGITDEALRTSSAKDLRSNQVALALAMRDARLGQQNRPVLIDAHSVIDNDKGLVWIPYEAIEPLCIGHYLFLSADPETIAHRRACSDRVRPIRSVEVLRDQQQQALAACKDYAQQSGAPLTVLESTDGAENLTSALCVFQELTDTTAQSGGTGMNIRQITQAINGLDAQGHARIWIALRDGEGVEVPLGEDNAALTFDDKDGAVTFSIGGKPRTTAIRLEDIDAIRASGED